MPKLKHWSLFSPERHQTHIDKMEGYFRVVCYKHPLKSSRVAFTDFSRHWMRSLKIKGCNYILLAAVNLNLKQIIMLVSFWRKTCSEKREGTALGLKPARKLQRNRYAPKKHLSYLSASFRVGKLTFRATFCLNSRGNQQEGHSPRERAGDNWELLGVLGVTLMVWVRQGSHQVPGAPLQQVHWAHGFCSLPESCTHYVYMKGEWQHAII